MKFKRLIPALAMLLVSAILLGTSTFAWFSMNTQVTAANMQVRAVAEQGILINEVALATDTNWDNLADAKQAGTGTLAPLSQLYPASTANGTAWFHAASKKSSSAASATADSYSEDLTTATYDSLSGLVALDDQKASAVAGSQAQFETMGKAATDTAGYYVHYVYYLKSSGSEINLGTASGNQNLAIKSVNAQATANPSATGTSGSTNLNKALRVGIKVNSQFYIYAPLADSPMPTYYVGDTHTAVTPIASATQTATDLAKLPASGANGAQVDVYIWYEGEDANCKTDNATAAILDNIKVDITFALVTL